MRRLVLLGLLMLAVGASASIEKLGQPCRGKNILSGRMVTDRATGREVMALVDMNETTGAELLFIDFEKNTGKKFACPGGSGSWALNEVPGDRLVIGTFYDGKFMVFDLKTMEFIKDVVFPGESYIWNLALGGDGRIYGGSYGNGKLGALDLNTYEVEDLGNPAPPNLYCRYVSALPDGRILCQFGQEKNTVLIFDPTTKKFEPVPKSLEGITAGISWHGFFIAGAEFFNGNTLEPVNPPFPTPPEDRGSRYVNIAASNDDLLVIQQKNYTYTYQFGGEALRLISEIDLSGNRIVGASKKSEILAYKGDEYIVVRPHDTKPDRRPMPVESSPRPTHFLRCDDEGILWGGTNFGQTLWWMDPKTGKYENTPIITNAGGEAYDIAFKDGKAFAVCYVGGDVVRYDRKQSWDQKNDVNPKTIAHIGAQGFIRPVAGTLFGPDGKLYTGWMAGYGTYGGAVSITDPETGETELIKNPLGEQAVEGVKVDSEYLYVSTSLGANGLTNKKDESAKFGIIDLATKDVVFEKTFEGASSIGVPGYDEPTHRLLLTNAGKLMVLDTKRRDFLTLPDDTPGPTCHSMIVRDGCLYYGSKNTVIKLDIRKRKWTKIADTPLDANNVAVGPDGTVYFNCGADVYVIRDER